MTLRTVFLVLLLLLSSGCAESEIPLPEAQLTIERDGGEDRLLSSSDLRQSVPVNDVRLADPHDYVERSYRGFPLPEVLDQAYGPQWQEADEVVFVCLDGYEASVPVSLVKSDPAHLAVAFSNGSPFRLFHRGQDIDFGPFYLVWDQGAQKENVSYNWPYQIHRIRLARHRERHSAAAPPEGSSEAVQRGYQAFATYCQTCHSVNGYGGLMSVDLAYPMKVTDYWQEGSLHKLIDDPSSVRANSRMPALRAEIPNRDRVIGDLVSYLKAVPTRTPAADRP